MDSSPLEDNEIWWADAHIFAALLGFGPLLNPEPRGRVQPSDKTLPLPGVHWLTFKSVPHIRQSWLPLSPASPLIWNLPVAFVVYSSMSDPWLSTVMGLTSLLVSLMLFFPGVHYLLFFTSNGTRGLGHVGQQPQSQHRDLCCLES